MRRFLLTAIALCAVFSNNGYADNFTVDKVYHPYVLPFDLPQDKMTMAMF